MNLFYFPIISQTDQLVGYELITLRLFLPGPDNLDNLRKLAEQFNKKVPNAAVAQEDDDDDVPDLVPGETFEGAAEEDHTAAAKEHTTAAEEGHTTAEDKQTA